MVVVQGGEGGGGQCEWLVRAAGVCNDMRCGRRTTANPAASTMQLVRSAVSHKGITAAHYQQHHAL
jgi:hypothetical protein